MKKTGYLGGTITVTGAAVSGATIVVTNVSGAAVNTADRLPAGKYTIAVTRDGYIATSKEVTLKDKDALVVDIDLEKMIEVEKVEALNLKEVKVSFTKALTAEQQTEAKKTSNYTIYKDGSSSTTSIATITVAEDGKSAILLLTDTLEQGKTANKVTVKKAIGMFKDFADEKVASNDVSVPQVDSITAVGNQVIKVQFTEAIQSAGGADIEAAGTNGANSVFTITKGDTTLTGNGFTSELSADKRTVTITMDTPLDTADYKVAITAGTITDFASYSVPAVTKTVTVSTATKVATPKAVTVNSRNEVVVDFDGVVNTSRTAKLTWKTATASKSVTGAEAVKGNTALKFTFPSESTLPVGTVDFTLEGVKDAYDYNVPTHTFSNIEVKADSIATATVKVENDGQLEVTFSKKMQGTKDSSNSTTAGDVNNKANYIITNVATGEAEDLTTVNAQYKEIGNTDGTTTYKVILSKTGWALKGDYTVTVSGAKDAVGTEMTKMVQTVNVKDTTRPTVVADAKYSDTSKKISVTYSEEMATSGDNSILNAANYKLGDTKLSDMTGVTLTSSDSKTVIITLPNTASVTAGITKLYIGEIGTTIKTVADKTGNILTGNDGGVAKEVDIVAEVPPTINSVATKVSGANTILVAGTNFSKVVASDFEYTVDGSTYKAPQSATLKTIDKVQYIELTISDTLSAKTDITKVSVRTKTTGDMSSESALGSKPANSESAATIVPDLASWPFKASIKSAEVLNDTTIRVEFDGLIGPVDNTEATGTIEGLKEFLAIDNTGNTATVTISDVEKDGDSAAILTVANLDKAKPVIVKTNSYKGTTANWAKDKNGIIYAENTTGVTASVTSQLKAYKFVSNKADLDNATAFTVTFNEAISETSVGVGTEKAVTIDATGKLTVAGCNFGEITGITVNPNALPEGLKGTVALDGSGTELTLTLTAGTLNSAVINGTAKYTPSSNITAATDTNKKVTTATVESTALDAKAVVYKAVTNTDKNEVTVTFSEAMDTTTFNTTNITDGTASISTAEGAFTWSNGNKTVVIKLSTAMSASETIIFTTACKDAAGTTITEIILTADEGMITVPSAS